MGLVYMNFRQFIYTTQIKSDGKARAWRAIRPASRVEGRGDGRNEAYLYGSEPYQSQRTSSMSMPAFAQAVSRFACQSSTS